MSLHPFEYLNSFLCFLFFFGAFALCFLCVTCIIMFVVIFSHFYDLYACNLSIAASAAHLNRFVFAMGRAQTHMYTHINFNFPRLRLRLGLVPLTIPPYLMAARDNVKFIALFCLTCYGYAATAAAAAAVGVCINQKPRQMCRSNQLQPTPTVETAFLWHSHKYCRYLAHSSSSSFSFRSSSRIAVRLSTSPSPLGQCDNKCYKNEEKCG